MRRSITIIGLLLAGAIGIMAFTHPHHLVGGGPDKDSVNQAADTVLTKLHKFFPVKAKAMPGEWLYHKKQGQQSFKAYRRMAKNRVSEDRDKIYFSLIGTFTPEEREIIASTRSYVEAYYGVPVVMLHEVSDSIVPSKFRRINEDTKQEQLNAWYILNKIMGPERPDDALAYMAFTNIDLYPRKKWNFVFGLANPLNRTGIWSMARYGDPASSDAAYELCLNRTLKVASHEIGHIFRMRHCVDYECNMNGSMGLEESDKQVSYLCPVCISKVSYATGISPTDRLSAMEDFWKRLENDNLVQHYKRCIKALEE